MKNMFNNRRVLRHTKKCEINIIPFVDILLILLLIFIISTPIGIQNFEVNLPLSSYLESINNSDSLKVIIEVLGNNRYNISFNKYTIKNISYEQLLYEISLKRNIKIDQSRFLIAGANNIFYTDIVKVLKCLYAIGIKTVNILIQPI